MVLVVINVVKYYERTAVEVQTTRESSAARIFQNST